MKKVLIVSCDGLGNGGIQHVMMNIVRNLSGEFHFDMLLFTHEVRHFDAEFQKYGTIFRIPNYKGPSKLRRKLDGYVRFWRIYQGVKKILQENGPYDVIHCHNYFEAAPCLLAAKHCQVPIRISHSHSAPQYTHFLTKIHQILLRSILVNNATHLVGCSKNACNYLFGKTSNAKSVPNAIDLKRFDRLHYSQPKIKHSFIHVGSLGIPKNQSFVLDVFKAIQTHWPDATLKLIGNKNESYEKILRQKIADLHLENVEFLPHHSDIPALLAQSEYMIFPSLFEGFGLALVEAQAMQVKCVASNTVPRETDIGLCQYLPLKQSPEQWAQAVLDMSDKPIPQPNTQGVDLNCYIDKIRSLYLSGEKQ